MPEIGQTISHYRITEKLGQGGMGEVFLAHDISLDRKVALKFLPDIFSGDPERLARFEREARLLASLNHPNIATIYGLEQAEGKRFLAMELVEGETLAQRIAKGPLPVDEALEVCRQIAEGLEAAHERGVIHRDLKPANIKITPEGKVKILDFGLAKAFQEEAAAADLSQSPTLTAAMTRAGVILGTAAYMSPEQAKGKPVDKRTDIWALGCILYECLTGRRAFEGETVTETLAAVISRQPDWSTLPSDLPRYVRSLLQRCLERDSNERLRDIGEARIELRDARRTEARDAPAAGASAERSGSAMRPVAIAAVALLSLLVGVAGALWFRPSEPAPGAGLVARFEITLDSEKRIDPWGDWLPWSISKDGRMIAWWGGLPPKKQIFLRSLENLEIRSIPGTEAIRSGEISFSPDGRWLAFSRDHKLFKVSLDGGKPVPIAANLPPAGIAYVEWAEDAGIIVSLEEDAIYKITPDGSTIKPLAKPDAQRNEVAIWQPQLLPGGRALLLTVAVGNWNDNHVEALSLETGERKTVIEDASIARYVSTGHLIYPRDEVLYAVPFDAQRLEKTGEEKPVLSDVMMDYASGRVARYAVSPSGILVYLPIDRNVNRNRLHWVSRQGGKTSVDLPDVYYRNPAVSPDGTRIAYRFRVGHRENIGIYDLQRKVPTTLTRAGSSNIVPVWHPDNKQIAFCSNREGQWNLWIQAADRSNEARRLHPSKFIEWPSSWSPDGRYLLFVRRLSDGSGIYLLDANRPDAQPVPLSENGAMEQHARFSPNGRLIAFTDTSQQAVNVMEFDPDNPRRGRTQNVSRSQVSEPVWSSRGDRLYYRATDGTRIFSVPIMAGSSLRMGAEEVILDGQTLQAWTTNWGSSYDISPENERFIALLLDTPFDKATTLVVVLNWFEELKRLVSTGK